MRARQVLVSVVSAVTVAGALSLAAAPAANAANIDLVADCSGSSGPIVLPLEASPGDVITITGATCHAAQIDGPGVPPGDYFSSYADGPGEPPYVFVVRTDAPLGEVNSTFNFGAQSGGGDATAMLWHLTIVAPAAATTADSAPIPAWVQAYGRDKDATCVDGWSPSWQSWAEPVTGGWVCTRDIPSLG